MIGMKRRELEKACAKLLRKHQRTLFGNCKCGWTKPSLNQFGDPEPDHADHVSKYISDCIWSVLQ